MFSLSCTFEVIEKSSLEPKNEFLYGEGERFYLLIFIASWPMFPESNGNCELYPNSVSAAIGDLRARGFLIKDVGVSKNEDWIGMCRWVDYDWGWSWLVEVFIKIEFVVVNLWGRIWIVKDEGN